MDRKGRVTILQELIGRPRREITLDRDSPRLSRLVGSGALGTRKND